VGKLSTTISPTLLNEFVASYTTDHLSITNTNPSVWTRGPNFTMTGLFPNVGGKLPDICLSTNGAYGGSFCEGPTAFPWSNSNPTFTYRDNVTKSLGKHKLVFGGYFVNAEKNEFAFTDLSGDLAFDTTASAITAGNALADLLMGNIASYTQASAQPKYHINYKIFEPFFQDDFHVSKNLTLNLGVRVSLFGTFWEKNHLVGNWDPVAYSASTAPRIDDDGSVTGQVGALIPGIGNPLDGIVRIRAQRWRMNTKADWSRISSLDFALERGTKTIDTGGVPGKFRAATIWIDGITANEFLLARVVEVLPARHPCDGTVGGMIRETRLSQ